MPFLILFAEIMLVYYFVQAFGFLNFIFFYAVSTFLGIIVVRIVGSKSLREFQTGQMATPNRSLISQGLFFVSGLMLIIPSMGTKAVGAVLLIPPVRWLAAIAFNGFLMKRVFNQNSFVHQFGNGGFRFYYQSSGQQNPFQNQTSNEADASRDVIDAQYRKIEDKKLIE